MAPAPEKPLVVPVFLPQAGCPRQCVFCDQAGITSQPVAPIRSEVVTDSIDRFLERSGPGRFPVEISFYGGNFLGLDASSVHRLLRLASVYVREGRCHHLRFSTRPDTVTPETLDLLADYPVKTVEIGVQSMDDGVLARCRRGHTSADTLHALRMLKERGFRTGAQLMTGLPGQKDDQAVAEALRIADLAPDFVRIYPTLVMAGSPLARWYRQGRYHPGSLETAVETVAGMVDVFARRGIPVIRMGLQLTAAMQQDGRILAGPAHPAFGHLVYCTLMRRRVVAAIEKEGFRGGSLHLCVNPREVSRMRGQGNETIRQLQHRFGFNAVVVEAEDAVASGEVSLRHHDRKLLQPDRRVNVPVVRTAQHRKLHPTGAESPCDCVPS